MSFEMERSAHESLAAPRSAALKHLDLLWSAFLAFGMVLSLTPQLRWGAAGVGPGELLVSLWLLPGLIVLIVGFRAEAPRALWELIGFWAIFTAAQSLGAIQTIWSEFLDDWSLVFHDIIAYLLLFVLMSVLFALPGAARRVHRVQWITALFGTFLFVLQAANAWGVFTLSNIDPWYWDRLRGWSDNPNQFALLALLVGFLSLELAEKSVGIGPKLLAAVCAAISLGIGWLGQSNAYSGVVILTFGLFGLLKVARVTMRSERQGFPATALGTAALASLMFVSFLFAPAIASLVDERGGALSLIARKGEDQDSEAKLRLYLWKEAIERGVDSWTLGYGPGPHLDIPQSLTESHRTAGEPINLTHPKTGLAPNYESHNTLLELFVQGGFLAVGAFVWIGATAVWRSWKAGMDGLIALLFAAAAFGSFHVVFRHPIVWFTIGLGLQAQRGFRESAAVSRGREEFAEAPR
jgi:O-Antigen ligase